MDTWILSESETLASSIRRSLARLGIDCPAAKVLSTVELDRLAEGGPQSGKVVFVAVFHLLAEHYDLLRRLRTLTEKEVVVVASPPDHATLLKAMRAGATDYLNADGRLDEEIEEFTTRVRADRSQASSKGRIVSVIPCHGTPDASVLAVNVAAVIAKRLGTCGLLDFHLRGGDLALLLKATPRHTIQDLVNEQERLDESMLQQALTLHSSGIRLLAGPPMFSDLRGFGTGICQRILTLAQYSHPFVIVNCEDIAHSEQVQSLASSDEILLAIRMDLVSLHRAKQYLDFLTRNRVPATRIHVVAMGAGQSGELPTNAVKNVLGVSVLYRIPDDQAAVTVSINVGNPLVLESPKSPLSKTIVEFVESWAGFDKNKDSSNPRRTWFGKAAAALAVNAMSY